jgi:MFS family permease
MRHTGAFRRSVMSMSGMALFALASLAAGFAQNETWLITARAVQGLGAAIASPAALSIITCSGRSLSGTNDNAMPGA